MALPLTDTPTADIDPELLQNLARQTAGAIEQGRRSVRLERKLKVIVRPGNASQLLAFKLQGLTADLSSGGCRLVLPLPLGVGDIYRLEFDAREHQLPQLFARCVRCRVLRDDAFESGMQFFTPLELPATLRTDSRELLD